VIDSGHAGGARGGAVLAATNRLTLALRRDPEVARATFVPAAPFLDPSGRYARVMAVGRHEYGDPAAEKFVHRVRGKLIAAAAFPARTRVLVGGGPATAFDFQRRLYQYFPSSCWACSSSPIWS